MRIGIDLGSRTIKVAAFRDGALIDRRLSESGFDPSAQALEMLRGYEAAAIVATGYGRHLAAEHFAHEVITEIKAHALGARQLFPGCRTILDVGGQDSKVILLDEAGRVTSFQMNDKCAAGTGRFLEMMAVSLGYELDAFGHAAAETELGAPINSMCAVFAESEVVSLKNQGVPPATIARSVHLAVAGRLAAMVAKSGYGDHLVFSGGVANNRTLVALLEQKLGIRVQVPPIPSIVGALGAALHGSRS